MTDQVYYSDKHFAIYRIAVGMGEYNYAIYRNGEYFATCGSEEDALEVIDALGGV